jgi:hypothetical protein
MSACDRDAATSVGDLLSARKTTEAREAIDRCRAETLKYVPGTFMEEPSENKRYEIFMEQVADSTSRLVLKYKDSGAGHNFLHSFEITK